MGACHAVDLCDAPCDDISDLLMSRNSDDRYELPIAGYRVDLADELEIRYRLSGFGDPGDLHMQQHNRRYDGVPPYSLRVSVRATVERQGSGGDS